MVNRKAGFTLIEMLVASAIFVLLGMASYAVLSSVMESDRVSLESADTLNNLQRTLFVMERDFQQLAPRKVRLEGEPPNAQLIKMDEGLFQSEAQGIQFARNGWRNPQMILPRGTVQTVIYRIFEGNLERLHFTYPDTVIGEEAKTRILMEGVSDLKFQFFANNIWDDEWQNQGLPEAIAIEFESNAIGTIRRVFLTPRFEQSNDD